MALGVVVTRVERLANGTGHREARAGHRLAWPRLSRVLDVEESPTLRAPTSRRRNPGPDSDDVAGESAVGRATHSRRAPEVGVEVSQATVAKYMVRSTPSPSQSWRTFLVNHVQRIAAADFFVLPTVKCRLLFVLVILAHERRQIMHVAVTPHPTAAWTAQQFREAFPWDQAPRYLIHDGDLAFQAVAATAKSMGTEDVRTAPRSPWQNAYVERFIGSVRRECLDHAIAVSAPGLQRVVKDYVAYYMRSRTHLSLDKDSPTPRPVMPPTAGRIVAVPEVNGLHHRYDRAAA